MVKAEALIITSESGDLAAKVFKATAPDALLVIASATGVKQNYYADFAKHLSTSGISVITFDYYGIGESLDRPIKELTNSARDWGAKDLEAVLQFVIDEYPDLKKILLGHSIGGQLIGLAPSAKHFDKFILVAAQSGYWKHWKGSPKMRMWFNWSILIPGLVRVFAYLPSKRVTGMENLPKNVAMQWRNWSQKPNYLLDEIPISETVYPELNQAATAISIDDDYFAPKPAVDWLTSQYSAAQIKTIHLVPASFGLPKIGHFGVFKSRFKDTIWPVLYGEIES